MDFTKVLNLCWFNFILGFNSTFLSGLDMVFAKNGFEKILKKFQSTLKAYNKIYIGVHQDVMSYRSGSCYVWLSFMAHCVTFSVQHVKSGLICLFRLLFKK